MQQYPTSSVQDGFIHASGLTESNNTVPAAWEIRGNFGSQDILRAFQRLVEAHEGLRTSIARDGKDRFVQRVAEGGDVARAIRVFESPGGDVEAMLKGLMGRLLAHRFDLRRPPLWRGFLVRTGRSSWVLGIAFNHVIMDGYSVGVISRHLATALATGSLPAVPPLGAFAEAERSTRPSSEQLAHWREQYGRRTPLRPTWRGRMGHYHVMPVPAVAPDAVTGLKHLAESVEASVSTAFAAVTAVAAMAVLECERPILGFATAQRTKANAEVFGPLHDHLPALGGAPLDVPFVEFVRGLHKRRGASRKHRLPSGALEAISGTTPYDVAVNFSPFAAPTKHDAGKGGHVIARPIPTIGRVAVARATCVAPVVAAILRPNDDGSLTGDITGISALHPEAQIRTLAVAFTAIAQRGLARPDAPLGALMKRGS
jgi:hypothetical protein